MQSSVLQINYSNVSVNSPVYFFYVHEIMVISRLTSDVIKQLMGSPHIKSISILQF